MIIHYNPDEHEVKHEEHICPFHKKYPGKPYAGCTCSATYSLVKKGAARDE